MNSSRNFFCLLEPGFYCPNEPEKPNTDHEVSQFKKKKCIDFKIYLVLEGINKLN